MNPMLQQFLATLIRAGLLAISGWLVKAGLFKESDLDNYIAGATVFVLTVLWALWVRYKSRVHFLTALTVPPGTTENEVKLIAQTEVTPTVLTPPNTVPGVPKEGGTSNIQPPDPPVPPFRPPVWIVGALLAFSLVVTGCAVRWIDKVSQTRAASVKVGYRAGAEYNAWLQPRTNNPAAYRTTYGALMTQWTNVDFNARQMGRSALLLESLEDTYRATPTNQSAIVAVVNDLALQSSNLNVIVKGIGAGER